MSEECILVVEDEPKLVRLIQEILHTTGFKVISTGLGKQAIELTALEQPDLMLLDIVLTGEIDGYQVARSVREFSELPIIMLTAKARESDLLRGFEAGADDYITKPFSSKELLARIRALLKRTRREPTINIEADIICGSLHIELHRRRVCINDREIRLTRTEFDLLQELALHRNHVLSHEHLLTIVWGQEYRDDVDYLRAYIRFLRKKLEPDPSTPSFLVTCQGVGYMLECSEQA